MGFEGSFSCRRVHGDCRRVTVRGNNVDIRRRGQRGDRYLQAALASFAGVQGRRTRLPGSWRWRQRNQRHPKPYQRDFNFRLRCSV